MKLSTLERSRSRPAIWVNPLIAWILAAVFATAAITKLVNFTDFLRVVRGYELFPTGPIPLLAALLVSLELTIAVALVLPGLRRVGALSSALALVFFIGFVSLALSRGLVVDCGCFVFLQSRNVGIGLLVQDLVLLALALLLIYRTGQAHGLEPPGLEPERSGVPSR